MTPVLKLVRFREKANPSSPPLITRPPDKVSFMNQNQQPRVTQTINTCSYFMKMADEELEKFKKTL